MTIPGVASIGLPWLLVEVDEVTDRVATVKDSYGKYQTIRLYPRRGGGPIPRPGEVWVCDRSMGEWTFAAVLSPRLPSIEGSGDEALQNLLAIMGDMGLVVNNTVPSTLESEVDINTGNIIALSGTIGDQIDRIDELETKHRERRQISVAQPIPNGGRHNVGWDVITWSESTLWTWDGSGEIATVTAAGWYEIVAGAQWANGTGQREVRILASGGNVRAQQSGESTGTHGQTTSTGPIRLEVGNTIKVDVLQSSGAQLDLMLNNNTFVGIKGEPDAV